MKKTCWIARDIDGDLYLHFEKPVEDYVTPKFWISNDYVNISKTSLDMLFNYITPGDVPIEILIQRDLLNLNI